MKRIPSFLPPRVLIAGMCGLALGWVQAAPGAHGPNGEHLDGPSAAAVGSGLPRLEAHSEQFEIVGRLEASGLVLYVNRYETNEAVLGARLDVELNGLNAPAVFQSEPGSYRVGDAKLLGALRASGNHALVFTVATSTDTDLLEAKLPVAAPQAEAQAGGGVGRRAGMAVLALGGALALGTTLLRRRRSVGRPA